MKSAVKMGVDACKAQLLGEIAWIRGRVVQLGGWVSRRLAGLLSTTPPAPPNGLRSEAQAALIEQEHRTIQQWANLWNFGLWCNADDPRRTAARRAFLWGMFTSTGPVVSVSCAGLISALVGVWLAAKANALFETQNEYIAQQNTLVRQQNALSEANRRVLAAGEMTAIADRLSELLDNQANSTAKSRLLARRVVAFSRSLRPYVFLEWSKEGEDGTMLSKPLSPERAQLFLLLIGFYSNGEYDQSIPDDGTETSTEEEAILKAKLEKRLNELFDEVIGSADFSYADLRNVELTYSSLELSEVSLNHANLEGANLMGIYFQHSGLIGANVHEAKFSRCGSNETVIDGINASHAQFDECEFNEFYVEDADFTNTVFKNTKFEYANAKNVDFSSSDLSGVDFEGSYFVNCNFRSSYLPPADKMDGVSFESGVDFEGAFVQSEHWLAEIGTNGTVFDPKDWILTLIPPAAYSSLEHLKSYRWKIQRR